MANLKHSSITFNFCVWNDNCFMSRHTPRFIQPQLFSKAKIVVPENMIHKNTCWKCHLFKPVLLPCLSQEPNATQQTLILGSLSSHDGDNETTPIKNDFIFYYESRDILKSFSLFRFSLSNNLETKYGTHRKIRNRNFKDYASQFTQNLVCLRCWFTENF